jgi:hypothetical protein
VSPLQIREFSISQVTFISSTQVLFEARRRGAMQTGVSETVSNIEGIQWHRIGGYFMREQTFS